jgi:CDP-diacylglycerol--glycerol-3-phosphate 3-phosphatidyltransferase
MRGVYAAKPWFVRRLARLENAFVRRGVSANSITLGAVAVSVVGGTLLALGGLVGEPRLWLFVPPLAVARLALNALDGSVARRSGTTGPFGVVTNELGDRLQEAALMAPLALVVSPVLAVGALAASFLTSTCGLLGQTVGGERLTTGPAGKADRVLLLASGSLVAGLAGDETPLGIALGLVLAGSCVTVVLRVAALRRMAGGPDVR